MRRVLRFPESLPDEESLKGHPGNVINRQICFSTMPSEDRPPLVSVIIPAYNSASFVHLAVQSALEQSYARREIIVVDDGSSDGTRKVLDPFHDRVKYIYRQNGGPSAARNTGIESSEGDFLCFLDADDIWASNKLERQIAFMEHHRNVALLSCGWRKFRNDGSPQAPFLTQETGKNDGRIFPVPEAFIRLVKSNFITTSTVMARRECFEKAGLFDVKLPTVEDRDMWLRISAHLVVAHAPWIVCKKRVHPTNVSRDKERMFKMRVRVLEKNRSLFPGLAPSSLWNNRLAQSHWKAGCVSLAKNNKVEARRAALRSLRHALRLRAAMLFVATYMGQRRSGR
jgi:glycosyltransferase involved in cell wall biosynthesis